jgi:uncharacterized protein (DUF302 family)
MVSLPENELVHLRSPYSVPETLKRLESVLHARNLTVFARIDHSGEAEKVGLTMHPTQLIIFGSPKSGTPVMVASPTVAIDLPLKALAWEDADGKVWLSYNSPEYLKRRHEIPDDLVKYIAGGFCCRPRRRSRGRVRLGAGRLSRLHRTAALNSSCHA